MSKLKNTTSLLEQMGDLSRQEALFADIAISLAHIADALEGTIKIEEMKLLPSFYIYDDPKNLRGGRGGK